MGSEFSDIDNLVLLLFELDVLSEEVFNDVLDNSWGWWPVRGPVLV